MIVCHCRSRSDREIREAVERGARTVEDVGRRCGAGSDCGACRPALEWLIVETTPPPPRGGWGAAPPPPGAGGPPPPRPPPPARRPPPPRLCRPRGAFAILSAPAGCRGPGYQEVGSEGRS